MVSLHSTLHHRVFLQVLHVSYQSSSLGYDRFFVYRSGLRHLSTNIPTLADYLQRIGGALGWGLIASLVGTTPPVPERR